MLVWISIRLDSLKTQNASGSANLTEGIKEIGTTHKEDVTDLFVKVLASISTKNKHLSWVFPEILSFNER